MPNNNDKTLPTYPTPEMVFLGERLLANGFSLDQVWEKMAELYLKKEGGGDNERT